jgi:hypothetical protein
LAVVLGACDLDIKTHREAELILDKNVTGRELRHRADRLDAATQSVRAVHDAAVGSSRTLEPTRYALVVLVADSAAGRDIELAGTQVDIVFGHDISCGVGRRADDGFAAA